MKIKTFYYNTFVIKFYLFSLKNFLKIFKNIINSFQKLYL